MYTHSNIVPTSYSSISKGDRTEIRRSREYFFDDEYSRVQKSIDNLLITFSLGNVNGIGH